MSVRATYFDKDNSLACPSRSPSPNTRQKHRLSHGLQCNPSRIRGVWNFVLLRPTTFIGLSTTTCQHDFWSECFTHGRISGSESGYICRLLDFQDKLLYDMITIGTNLSNNNISVLPHDGILSARWSRFARALALSDANRRYYIGLVFQGIDLSGVFNRLLLSFDTASILVLLPTNNVLGRNGLTFAVSAVKASATLGELHSTVCTAFMVKS